jgi:hypothetical protein
MKRLWLLFALTLPLAAQQGFDFKSLDKLGAKATDTTNITLEGDSLKFAANFLGNDKDAGSLKSLVANLKSINVRSWEFDREGMYNSADLEPFRAYLRGLQWPRVVEVKEGSEVSEVFLKATDANTAGGVAVISAEPRELTIVYIEGAISMADLAKLSGSLDIPDLEGLKHRTGTGRKSNANGKKDE